MLVGSVVIGIAQFSQALQTVHELIMSGSAPNVASAYVHPGGRFERQGDVWIEHPPYAPGSHFVFKELRRDSDYLYLFDETRTKDGDVVRPMYLRVPVKGGVVQWSYPNPILWNDVYVVEPE